MVNAIKVQQLHKKIFQYENSFVIMIAKRRCFSKPAFMQLELFMSDESYPH